MTSTHQQKDSCVTTRNEDERFINHLGGKKQENDEHNLVPSGCMMYVYFLC